MSNHHSRLTHAISLLCQRTLFLLAVFLLVGCSSPAPAAAPRPHQPRSAALARCRKAGTRQTETRKTEMMKTLYALLVAEGEFVVAQNIDSLMRLWAENGRVVDAKNTPDNGDDDQVWDGKDAIRHRYVRTVFPGAPAVVDHGDESITIEGDQAQQSTTTIGSEVAPAGDRWEMVRQGDCWYLASLTYNLEPAP